MAEILKDGKYESEISSGSHGDTFQKQLALTMFLRMRESSSSFRLAYEVKKANKFDDIVLIDDIKKEIHFIQVKHGNVTDDKVKHINVDALFPTAGKGKCSCKGDFVLCKYVNSFLTVNQGFNAEKGGKQYTKKFYIFSNKFLREKNDPKLKEWLETLEEQQVNKILRFPGLHVRHLKLTPTEKAINQLSECVNKVIIQVKDAIKELFDSAKVSQILIDYCTPLKQVLKITKENKNPFSVSFNLKSFKDTHLYNLLIKDKFDMTKPVEIEENFLHSNSRAKDLPTYVSEDKVRDFFTHFTLSLNQPNDLRPTIDCELRTWMKTWVQPDILGRLCKKNFEEIFIDLEESFKELNKPDENKKKDVLQRKHTENFLVKIKNSNKSLKIQEAKQLQHYINRTIEYKENTEESTVRENAASLESTPDNKISDIQFIKELQVKFKDHQLIVLVAEPGMGKTSLLQFIAFEKQKRHDAEVFLVYFSDLVKELEKIDKISDLNGVLSILKAVLSEVNCDIIKNSPDLQDDKGHRVVLVMDGFDEIHTKYTEKVIGMLKQLKSKKSIQIVISSRMHAAGELERPFKVRSMLLEPFIKEDQISYLRKIWNVQEDDSYSNQLLEHFHSSIPTKLCEICGLPLMMRMLAEIYSDQFKKIHAGKTQQIDFSVDKINIAQLYEQFVRKCFYMKLKEKYNHRGDIDDPELDSVIEGYILEHQLLAMKLLDSNMFEFILRQPNSKKKYDQFQNRCVKGSEKSLLVKVCNENVQFCHLSYAEYFVAKFVCNNINLLGTEHVISIFSEHEIVRRLVLVQMDENGDFYEILNKLCTQNLSIAFWACESGCLSLVRYLVGNFKSFSSKNLDGMLHMSVEHGHYEICNFLIKNKSDPNTMNEKRWTTLHLAAKSGYVKLIKLLIMNGANINSRTIDDETSLHIAAQNGHENASEVLIFNNAAVTAVDGNQRSALHLAAENGHDLVINVLIKKGANVNSRTVDGDTALHIATQNGHRKAAEVLIDNNVNVNVTADKQWNVLHFAAQRGHDQIIKPLIIKGADPKLRTIDGDTPLHIAAQNGHKKAAEVLINSNVDVNAINHEKYTSLHLAAQNGHDQVVDLLLPNIANVDAQTKDRWTALHLAAQKGHVLVINMLIKKRADINSKTMEGRTPLHIASLNGHIKVATVLIGHNAVVDAVDRKQLTALHLAVQNRHDQMINMLIANGANINSRAIDGETPLHIAVQNGHIKAALDLINCNADVTAVDGKQRSALYLAAENGHDQLVDLLMNLLSVTTLEKELQVAAQNEQVQVIKLILNKISNTNLRKIISNNLLHFAAKRGFKNVVYTLIVRNVDVNAVNEKQLTALHLAARNKHYQVVDLLLGNKANVDAQDEFKWCALHFAAQNGDDQAINMLIDKGANINSTTIDGDNPLHITAKNGHKKAAEVLINSNADVNAMNHETYTSLHLAAQNGHDQVVDLLLPHIAYVDAQTKDRWTALHLAAEKGHDLLIHTLVKNGANINLRTMIDRTPLHIAALNGHIKVATALIGHNVVVDAVDRTLLTALHLAAQNRHDQVVKLLLQKEANVNAQDERKWSVLHLTAQNGYGQMINMLIANGANINSTTIDGETPLHIAAKNGHIKAADDLIYNNADVTAVDRKQRSALYLAAENDHDQLVDLLLKNLPSGTTPEKELQVALKLATKNMHHNAIKLLSTKRARNF